MKCLYTVYFCAIYLIMNMCARNIAIVFLPFFCSKLKIRQCCIENYATILDSSCIINLPVIHAVEKSDL